MSVTNREVIQNINCSWYKKECAICVAAVSFSRITKCMIRAIFTPNASVLNEMNVTIAFLFMYQYLIYIFNVRSEFSINSSQSVIFDMNTFQLKTSMRSEYSNAFN